MSLGCCTRFNAPALFLPSPDRALFAEVLPLFPGLIVLYSSRLNSQVQRTSWLKHQSNLIPSPRPTAASLIWCLGPMHQCAKTYQASRYILAGWLICSLDQGQGVPQVKFLYHVWHVDILCLTTPRHPLWVDTFFNLTQYITKSLDILYTITCMYLKDRSWLGWISTKMSESRRRGLSRWWSARRSRILKISGSQRINITKLGECIGVCCRLIVYSWFTHQGRLSGV